MASEFSEYLDHVATARSEYGRYINAFAVRGWVEQLPSTETPCFWHFDRLASSQSKLDAPIIMLAYRHAFVHTSSRGDIPRGGRGETAPVTRRPRSALLPLYGAEGPSRLPAGIGNPRCSSPGVIARRPARWTRVTRSAPSPQAI